MSIVFIIALFFLWAVFWSFGWVIIERGQWGYAHSRWKSIFWGRSYCPWCREKASAKNATGKNETKKHIWATKNDAGFLTRWKLIPIVWWAIQWGSCSDCWEEIPSWYVIFEMVMWAVFVATWLVVIWTGFDPLVALFSTWQWAWALVFWLLVNRLLMLLIVADFFYYELNVYAWILLLVTLVVYLWAIGAIVPWLIGWAVLGCVFLLIYLWAKRYAEKKFWPWSEGVWLGDVLLAVALWMLYPFVAGSIAWVLWWGVWAGVWWVDWVLLWWVWRGMSLAEQIVTIQMVFLYLILSSGLGIFYRIGQMVFAHEISREKQRDHLDDVSDFHMPFIPAMIVATWIMLLWWSDIVGLLV